MLVDITLQAMYGGSNFLFGICTSHISVCSDPHTLRLQWVMKSHENIINLLQYTYKKNHYSRQWNLMMFILLSHQTSKLLTLFITNNTHALDFHARWCQAIICKTVSLEIDVTWTKQCLPRLRLPTAKNASDKTLFWVKITYLAVRRLLLPWKSAITTNTAHWPSIWRASSL